MDTPKKITLISHLIEHSAKKIPEKPAIWHTDKWINYQDIDEGANKLANYFIKNGFKKGDRVALLYENSFNFIIAYFGILKAGCVVTAFDTDKKTEAIKYQIINSEARAIISSNRFTRQLLPAIRECPHLKEVIIDQENISMYREVSQVHTARFSDILNNESGKKPNIALLDSDLAAIVYTSGSTGTPKGVMLTHLNLVSNMKSIAEYLHLTEDDRIMVILPFYYIYGLSLLLTHILVGGSIVIDNRFIYPNVVLETMEKMKVTGFSGVPSTFTLLLHRSSLNNYKFDSLRYVSQAGGSLPVPLQKKVKEAFSPAKLYIMYGATEASPRLSYLDPDMLSKKWGSIGKAIPNVELFVADSEGNPVPQGEPGEIVARGPNIMRGYWKEPEDSAKVLKNGLYFTGDLGKMDEDGFIFIVGRKRDIIKVKGIRISAKEIEETIIEHPEIFETAVIGVFDDILGEAIKAYVRKKENSNLSENDLLMFCKKKLPLNKVPKYIDFIKVLPKDKSGKILKNQLRELEKPKN